MWDIPFISAEGSELDIKKIHMVASEQHSHLGRLMVGRPRRRLIDFFALGYLVIESRTLSPVTLMMVTGRLVLQAINQNDVGRRWGFSPKQHMPKLHP